MKNLLMVLVAMTMTVSAFADHHGHHGHEHPRNMVRFENMHQENAARSFDVSFEKRDTEKDDNSTNIALNYARTFGQWQVGVNYRNFSGDTQTTDFGTPPVTNTSRVAGTTFGLSGYYNFSDNIVNTCYIALHLMRHQSTAGNYQTNFGELREHDTATTIGLEYGHRWHIGHVYGVHLIFSPSVAYSMTSFDRDNNFNDDNFGDSRTQIAWNWLKFDVMF